MSRPCRPGWRRRFRSLPIVRERCAADRCTAARDLLGDSSYLALQDDFIDANRPVPRFIVLDQPSQAFFPRDREIGGDLAELSDTDRDNTRKLYRMMFDVVTQLNGQLQIIAFDHADFPDEWFQDSIIETWRDGLALIPRGWRNLSR